MGLCYEHVKLVNDNDDGFAFASLKIFIEELTGFTRCNLTGNIYKVFFYNQDTMQNADILLGARNDGPDLGIGMAGVGQSHSIDGYQVVQGEVLRNKIINEL